MAVNARGEEKNPYLRADSLDELLTWHDADFIRCAFVTILGRQPDLEGERHYLGRLRSGQSRLQILRDLRQSAEAKQHDPGIAGLDRALRLAAWQRVPFLGASLRWFTKYRDDNSTAERRFRELTNAAAANHAVLHSLTAQVRSLEWNLHHHGGVVDPANANRDSFPIQPLGLPRFEYDRRPELDHLATSSPLARYFASKVL